MKRPRKVLKPETATAAFNIKVSGVLVIGLKICKIDVDSARHRVRNTLEKKPGAEGSALHGGNNVTPLCRSVQRQLSIIVHSVVRVQVVAWFIQVQVHI